MLITSLALAALLLPQAPEPAPQAPEPPPQAPNPRPAFDVASVRPSTAQFSQAVKTDPERLVFKGASLGELIQQAYGFSALRVTGAPWLGRFDIEATAEGSHTRAELLEMLQTLLADRFKVAVHRQTKDMSVEALVIGKGAPKLQPAGQDVDPLITLRPNRSGGTVSSITLTWVNVTLPYLANYLSGRFNEVVIDETGLTGAFDFNVPVEIDSERVADPSVPEREAAAEIFTDFVKALGLKLERKRALVEVLVVDDAEHPDDN